MTWEQKPKRGFRKGHPKGSTMDVQRARELVAVERRRIEQVLADLREAESGRELSNEDQPPDQASDLTELEYAEGSQGGLDQRLEALERAEARLAAGTYGKSIESGRSIPDGRLEADPLAELTIEEERRLERSA
jgi:DnaK suppressor protein